MLLLYFISGIFFISFIYPILDGLTGLILSAIEEKKAKYVVSITRFNKEIQGEPPPAHQIGFVIDDEVDNYDE